MGWTCITPHGFVDTLGETVILCQRGQVTAYLGAGLVYSCVIASEYSTTEHPFSALFDAPN